MENNGSVTIAVNDFIHSLYAYKNISLYDANHVFDEEKSVRWNREEVERLNNSYDNRLSEAYTQARSEAAALSARIATGNNSEKTLSQTAQDIIQDDLLDELLKITDDLSSSDNSLERRTYAIVNKYLQFVKLILAIEDKFRVTADKSSLDKSDKTWSLIISDIKANSILPACKTDAGTLRDMYAMYAKRCSSCGLRFVRNYSVGSSTGTKAPAIIEVVLPDNSIGYYLLMCKANETKSGPSLRDAMPLISSMLMMESNGKRVLGAYFVADRFSNGFVQDVSRLVEPINRNRTDRFEIRVCDTNTPLVLAVPAVSAQAAPVNINVGITIKKTR